MLAMDVGKKVLGSLGQAQYGLKVNDFGTGLSRIAEATRQQLQVVQLLLYFLGGISLVAHNKRYLLVNAQR